MSFNRYSRFPYPFVNKLKSYAIENHIFVDYHFWDFWCEYLGSRNDKKLDLKNSIGVEKFTEWENTFNKIVLGHSEMCKKMDARTKKND